MNLQATEQTNRTLFINIYTSCSLVPLPANSDGRPRGTDPSSVSFSISIALHAAS